MGDMAEADLNIMGIKKNMQQMVRDCHRGRKIVL
jgi:hypothetical protein